jgi:hypothetical protein
MHAVALSVTDAAAPSASPALLDRIEVHRAALAGFHATIDGLTSAGKSGTDAETLDRAHGACNAAAAREADAMVSLLSHRCETLADVRAKAGYLLTTPGVRDDEFVSIPGAVETLLRSFHGHTQERA